MRLKDVPKLKDIIAYEKSRMLPLNFFFAYILAPAYVVLSVLLLIVFGILMEIDDEKYLVAGLLCLGFFVLMSIAVLALVPFVKKEAIKTELTLYDFDTSHTAPLEIYDFSTDDLSLKFNEYGMYLNDELFYYNHLSKLVVTKNKYNRIGIGIRFSASEEQSVVLFLDKNVLRMLGAFNIELENQQVLDYIISNKEEAFRQIYNKGFISHA